LLIFGNIVVLSGPNDTEGEYIDDEFEWVYLNLDLSYGSGGPGGALGVRYRFLGVAISATGFANDIPNTVPQMGNVNNLQQKTYPSNTVCADFYGYYDLDEVSLFASLGFYASVDSVLRWDMDNKVYYKGDVKSDEGVCFGLGAQMPLTFLNEDNVYLDQLVGGIGFHSKLGIFLRIAYRW